MNINEDGTVEREYDCENCGSEDTYHYLSEPWFKCNDCGCFHDKPWFDSSVIESKTPEKSFDHIPPILQVMSRKSCNIT